MKKFKYYNLLILIALIAVGQMTQTIYIPAIPNIAKYFNQPISLVQAVMGSYLLFYGTSQLFYGPLSDYFGRRPVILSGLIINLLATIYAIFALSLNNLIIASALQGLGIGVAGVMARTMPRDLYFGAELRYANSMLSMGILFTPLLAPIIGAVIIYKINWHAIYFFLLILSSAVFFSIYKWLPETKPYFSKSYNMFSSYIILLSNNTFNAYLIILISGLSGIVIYESISGILLGGVLGLSHINISIQFILPIPAAFLGSWLASKKYKTIFSLMWCAVCCCMAGSIFMWLLGCLGFINTWSLLIPASLFFFGSGILLPLSTTGAMEPFPFLAGSAGALIGGLQNIGSGFISWISSYFHHNGQIILGMLMFIISFIMLLSWLYLLYKLKITK